MGCACTVCVRLCGSGEGNQLLVHYCSHAVNHSSEALAFCSLDEHLTTGEPFSITVIQIYAPTTSAEEAEVERFYQDCLELTLQKDVLFIIGGWNAKVGSQEIIGVTGKFALVLHNEAGQRLAEFGKKIHWS